MTRSDTDASRSRGGTRSEPAGVDAEGVDAEVIPPREVPVAVVNCSIARTLGTLGEKWTFLILRDAFRGARRFEEFLSQTEIPRQVLSNRLASLTAQGILSKRMYREPGARARAEYVLTEKGLDTFSIVMAMRQWGDRWEADAAGPPMTGTHRGCGAALSVHMRCADGHEIASARDVTHRIEPSARIKAKS